MYKTYLLLSAFIFSAMFLFSCSSSSSPTCSCSDPSSSGVGTPSSSSRGVDTPSSSGGSQSVSLEVFLMPTSEGGTMQDQALSRKSITISSVKSYADMDGEPVAYAKDEVASNLTKIDMVAYCGTDVGCKNNSIYDPYKIVEVFWNPSYVGSNVYFFEIPSKYADIFRTAATLYEIIPTYNNLIKDGIIGGTGVDEISIAKGKVFFLVTSEDNRGFVIIKESNNNE